MELLRFQSAVRLRYDPVRCAILVAHRDGFMPEARVQVLSDSGNEANKFVTLVAWASGDVIAVKLVGVFPDNPLLPVPEPSVQGW